MMPKMIVHIVFGLSILIAIVFFTFMIASFGGIFISSSICSITSSWRHSWKGAGISALGVSLMYPSDYINVFIPLLGCQTRRVNIGTVSAKSAADTIGQHAVACWHQFGGGTLDVLWESALNENPWRCSEITFRLAGGEYMSPLNLTTYMKEAIFSRGKDCSKCTDPCVDDGFSCYAKNTQFCGKNEDNPYICRSKTLLEEYYVMCAEGVPTTVQGYWNCIDELSNYVCRMMYYYDDDTDDGNPAGVCRNANDPSITEPVELPAVNKTPYLIPEFRNEPILPPPYDTLYGGIFECMFCNNSISPTEYYYVLPQSCTIQGEVRDDCISETTYADYLKPGVTTLYSFKKIGEAGNIVDPLYADEKFSGDINVFIEYIDSFTHTRKDVEMSELPPECAVGTFLDSCSSCLSRCAGGTIQTFGLVAMVRQVPLIGAINVGTLFRIPTIGTWVSRLAFVGEIAYSAQNCLECLSDAAQKNNVDIAACEDMLLICFYEME